MDPIKVTLSRPIQAHGAEVRVLTLKEPTLGVLEDIEIAIGGGADGKGEVKINLGSIARVVAAMADIPPSSARQIAVGDLAVLGKAVLGFMPAFLGTGAS